MRLEYKNEIENAFKFWEVKIEGKKVQLKVFLAKT